MFGRKSRREQRERINALVALVSQGSMWVAMHPKIPWNESSQRRWARIALTGTETELCEALVDFEALKDVYGE
jgi:hypothetical protein